MPAQKANTLREKFVSFETLKPDLAFRFDCIY